MPGVDVQEVMRGIRERVRAKALRKAAAAEEEGAPAPQLPDLIHVRGHIAHAAAKLHRVGEMPLGPDTFRARMGAHAVRLVKRSLFWLTAQLHEAHEALLQTERSQADALQMLIDSQRHQSLLIESLQLAAKRQQQTNIALQCQWEDMIPQWDELGISMKTVRAEMDALAAGRERLYQRNAELEQQMEFLRQQNEAQAAAFEDQRQKANASAQAVEQLRRRTEELESWQKQQQKQPDPPFALLAEHAAAFRGDYEVVKRRLAAYLPHLATLARGAKTIDLGCGRGEWLDLMRENGIEATGVDLNPVLAAQCRSRSLHVVEADALDYLNGNADNSLDLVTAFHLVEHLPFPALLELLSQIRRVLKPGGLFVLETPNATSLFVGAHTFHLDPTHQRLLPPQLLEFLLTQSGFTSLRPMSLQPFPEHFLLSPDATGASQRLNEYLYGGQDYGLVGMKAAAASRAV